MENETVLSVEDAKAAQQEIIATFRALHGGTALQTLRRNISTMRETFDNLHPELFNQDVTLTIPISSYIALLCINSDL